MVLRQLSYALNTQLKAPNSLNWGYFLPHMNNPPVFQWCYWAHNGSEYPTTSHKGGGEAREPTVWGFQWRKSSTRCGLHFSQVGLEAGGRWKCHLANTDSRELEKIR